MSGHLELTPHHHRIGGVMPGDAREPRRVAPLTYVLQGGIVHVCSLTTGSYRSFCLEEGSPCQSTLLREPILPDRNTTSSRPKRRRLKTTAPIKANLFGGKRRKLPNSHAKYVLIYSLQNTIDSISGGAMRKKQESSTQHILLDAVN